MALAEQKGAFDWRSRSVITIEEYAQIMEINRTTAYECVQRGAVKSVRHGRRVMVPVPWLIAVLEGRADEPRA